MADAAGTYKVDTLDGMSSAATNVGIATTSSYQTNVDKLTGTATLGTVQQATFDINRANLVNDGVMGSINKEAQTFSGAVKKATQ